MANASFPRFAHNPRVLNSSVADEPAPWLTAIKDAVVEKLNDRRTSNSSASSTKTTVQDDNASTYSAATTLKGSDDHLEKKKKWFSRSHKFDTEQETAQKALHTRAVADYMALR
ncbi:hypothetical protein N7468_003381 [Penicillium chermesinum]|uniref:Uncharacterized protein n=1 Tax=Penicillium chermesinum TaxID=63820 RepID=A0A9W9TRR6_9EURO|nr:uncharacterized protein N7468_003381 [Penicillium chermesinum]KAJ5238762.1 hypothetical protein N7468_003381 [Penicillium chermesinum]KAJ6164405.1 hypothetical protein N7470_003077 [Penicillium chermesinum]